MSRHVLYTNFSLLNIYYSGKALIWIIYVYDSVSKFFFFCIYPIIFHCIIDSVFLQVVSDPFQRYK